MKCIHVARHPPALSCQSSVPLPVVGVVKMCGCGEGVVMV